VNAESTQITSSEAAARDYGPLYFESQGRTLFGWLHQPPAAASPRALGLVICNPFGYEALCAHRSLRAFATTAASLGIPALRFDYAGTGDSADTDPSVEQLEIWVRDVVAAVEELRRRCGVEHVCLLGLRLGALIAVLVAARHRVAQSLVLVAPILSGQRYLRELRTTQLAAAMSESSGERPRGSTLEFSGYSLAPATVAHLKELEVISLAQAPAPNILVIDRLDLPQAREWCESLARLGAKTRYDARPGFVEMTLTAPQFTVLPEAMLATFSAWIAEVGAPSGTPKRVTHSELGFLPLPADGQAVGSAARERPVHFGPDASLYGIVTEPARGELRRRAVILLNAGAVYHTGVSRMSVSLARRWAARGYVVLRMDLSSLGESLPRPGRPENEVFPPAAVEDMRAAVEFLRSHYSVGDLAIGGVCSGAYHALRAAVAGLAVDRILMVNPQNFFWEEGMTLTDLQLAEVVRNPVIYRERVFSRAAWRRLLSGQVNIGRIVGVYFHRVRIGFESLARDAARALRIHLRQDLGRELQEVAARGVKIVFIFSRGDPGIELLRIQGGAAVKALGARCRVHIIDGADHTFSHSAPRGVLEQVLSDELFERHSIRSE